jgi:hypothetical protein
MSDPALRTEGLLPWPALSSGANLVIESDWEEQWLDSQVPPELQAITVDAPLEVVQIIHDSLAREQYRPAPVPGQASAREQDRRTQPGGSIRTDLGPEADKPKQNDASSSFKGHRRSGSAWTQLLKKGTKQAQSSRRPHRVASEDREVKKAPRERKATG